MKELRYEKQLLIQKIDMQRRVLGLEARSFMGKVGPVASLFSRGQELRSALGSVGSLLKTLSGGGSGDTVGIHTLLSVVQVALPTVKHLLGKAKK